MEFRNNIIDPDSSPIVLGRIIINNKNYAGERYPT